MLKKMITAGIIGLATITATACGASSDGVKESAAYGTCSAKVLADAPGYKTSPSNASKYPIATGYAIVLDATNSDGSVKSYGCHAYNAPGADMGVGADVTPLNTIEDLGEFLTTHNVKHS